MFEHLDGPHSRKHSQKIRWTWRRVDQHENSPATESGIPLIRREHIRWAYGYFFFAEASVTSPVCRYQDPSYQHQKYTWTRESGLADGSLATCQCILCTPPPHIQWHLRPPMIFQFVKVHMCPPLLCTSVGIVLDRWADRSTVGIIPI